MTTKVRVTGDENGNVIGVSTNNPEYGYVRVEQSVTQINEQGWLRISKRSALIKGKVEDLKAVNFTAGQELPGKIVVIESLVPFNPDNPDRDLKIAGSTGVVCRIDDEPIYRQTFYTSNENASDELLMHTNSDEIKEVQSASRLMEAMHTGEPTL